MLKVYLAEVSCFPCTFKVHKFNKDMSAWGEALLHPQKHIVRVRSMRQNIQRCYQVEFHIQLCCKLACEHSCVRRNAKSKPLTLKILCRIYYICSVPISSE